MKIARLWTIGVSAAALALVAACGSSGSPKAGPSSGSTPATGTPINVMTIAPSGTATSNFPGIGVVAKAYATYVNAHGGINGHPLHVTVCNDKNDANAAADCARQAVSEHAVAVLGSFSLGSGQVLPILKPAGIPWLGGYALDPSEYTSTLSYPIVAGPLAFLASGVLAGKDANCTKIAIISLDIPAGTGLIPFIKQGVASQKKTVDMTVPVPVTTTDFSSIVASAKSATCTVMSLPDGLIQAYLGKAKSLGIKQRIYAPAGAMASGTIKAFADQIEGSGEPSSFVVSSDPAWATFDEAVKDAGADVDHDNIQNQNAWVSYVVLNQVASKLTGEITAATFKAALDQASSVDTGGISPVLDFTKPFPVPPLARLTDSQFVALSVHAGELVQQGSFVNYATFLGG